MDQSTAIIIIIFTIGIIWLYKIFVAKRKLYLFFKERIESIKKANNIFSSLLDFDSGYFNNYQLNKWKISTSQLYKEIKNKECKNILLKAEDIEAINKFKYFFLESDSLRIEFNKKFIIKELDTYKSFFNNIEGRALDAQQRTSIVTDEDNNIIIAGAGSGKTTTIVGKVNYLINKYKVNPEDILLISFTNNSAKTLADRININGIQAKTFHKFGMEVIIDVEGIKPSIFDSEQFEPLVNKYYNELIKNTDYIKLVTDYFINYLKPAKSQFEFKTKGDYIQFLKDHNLRSYKLIKISKNGKITMRMEAVKSIEECRIANFLLFNGIEYEYELAYEYETASKKHRQYKPDFTIFHEDKRLYIEHFGISRDGNVPPWFSSDDRQSAKEKYKSDMAWKISTHKKYKTTLIETFSYEMKENTLFDNLTKKLIANGIVLKPKTPLEIWEIITTAAKDEAKNFISLICNFITLMKSNNYTFDKVVKKNRLTVDRFDRKRNEMFLQIIKPIYDKYEFYLREERKELDFSDMINKASHYISQKLYDKKYKYIIIDEFQDISIGRYKLIDELKYNNPACKLFCVGDDWQSIYRFSGSDIALFKDFEKYFGVTVKSKIETTYRFQNPILKLSSDFIQKNSNQEKKDLRSFSQNQSTGYKIYYSNNEEQDDTQSLQNIFDELFERYEDIEKKEIMILSRYNNDLQRRIKNQNGVFRIDKEKQIIGYNKTVSNGKNKSIEARFLTVHKSKGLESDIVILLNCNSGKYGFPSEMSDDTVLNLLLRENDKYENSEERRLFYVAMTRAKEMVCFLTDSAYKSKFIAELEMHTHDSTVNKCPECITADLILKTGTSKNGSTYKFYGCSNYLYGCDYRKWL
jgi:DNA helicase-4